ncbi:MAG: chromate efflux transporter [Anaerolineae bacterium]|nr:chromate efflux transporter [Anaerolineae bacterium]
MTDQPTPRVSYGEIARLFLRLSLTAFGGPVAHIALAEDELVERKRWLSRDHFLALVSATNLIPGPNSTEVMIHTGYVLRGIPGALLSGACFIGPAFLLTLAFSVIYVSAGAIPEVGSLLRGISPVIVAIIAHVGWRLLRAALRDAALWLLFILGTAALLLPGLNISELAVMLAAGLLYAVYKSGFRLPSSFSVFSVSSVPLWWNLSFPLLPALQTVQAAPAALWDIFWYFLKIGSVLFGSGYILISYIQQDVVNGFGWLTTRQLLDAVAIGQTTPGPVLTTVTTVGYIVAGLPGAIVGTLGVFLPSFVLVILTAPLIPRMRRNRFLGAFLSGVNAGVLAAILVTLIDLGNAALHTADGSAWSPLAVLLALGALGLLLRFKVNATWLILAGGLIGLLTQL